jgi:hypothetical protein
MAFLLNGSFRFMAVAAYKLKSAIYDQLRSVDAAEVELTRIRRLHACILREPGELLQPGVLVV